MKKLSITKRRKKNGPFASVLDLVKNEWPTRASAIRSKKKRVRKRYEWYRFVVKSLTNNPL